MRVLHVIGWLAERYGGPVSAVRAMSRGLAAQGHQVHIVTTDADGPDVLDVPIAQPMTVDGYQITYFHLVRPRRLLVAPDLGRYLWKHAKDYDLVHIHSLYRFPNLAAATAARHHGVPYVVRPHGSLEPVHRLRRHALKAVYHAAIENRNIRGAAAIHYSSTKELEGSQLYKWMPEPFVVPNPVDAGLLRLEASNGLCPSLPAGPLITYLGRLTRLKGIDLLLEGFGLVNEQFPTAQLVIAGPDSDGTGAAATRWAAERGIADRVHVIGPIYGPDRAALVRSSRVFALLSDSENFGIAAVEAMALGVPVVVSREVGIQSLVQSAQAGAVVDRDRDQVAVALAHYLDSEMTAQGDGQRGARAVEREYSVPVVAAMLENMYRRILVQHDHS